MACITENIPTDIEASRFLAHATLGYTRADIEDVKCKGYLGWIEAQFALEPERIDPHWHWMMLNRKPALDKSNGGKKYEVVDSIWRRFIDDKGLLLRQKTVFALSQIIVASVEADFAPWEQFAAAHYMDTLEKEAFSTYGTLLERISLTPMMGYYLTYIGSRKENAAGEGSRPDENYARELLQLFTIGVSQLDADGIAITDSSGKEISSYTQDDIVSLARVFTGWTVNQTKGPDLRTQGNADLINIKKYFDKSDKSVSFLPGTVSGSAIENLRFVINGLVNHNNTSFFVARQLIQRFVTSNPSNEYVKNVAAEFKRTSGDMKAVLTAILMEPSLFVEGRRIGPVGSETFGKVREPVLRLVHWAKVFKVRSKSGRWLIDQSEKPLGQIPMRSPSVFNFYRPGYVPPSTEMSGSNPPLMAPEFQITNESSVISYINFMQTVITNGLGNGDVVPDYSEWLNLAKTSPATLVSRFNDLLACGQLKPTTVTLITNAVTSIKNAPDKRVHAAAMLVLCSPDFIVLK